MVGFIFGVPEGGEVSKTNRQVFVVSKLTIVHSPKRKMNLFHSIKIDVKRDVAKIL
jgi:hypothetical protein